MGNFSTKIASAVSATALVATAMSASLVSAASEFLPYADALASNGVINTQTTEAGYRLSDNITRAELAKVAANLGQYTPVACTGTVYTDVTTSLGDLCDAVETLAAAGVVTKANTTFRPLDNVTRAEMTKMLLGALGETPSTTSAGYADVTSTLGDLEGYINRANEMGAIRSATNFYPNNNGNRGEVFKIAASAAGLVVGTDDNNGTGTTNSGSTNGSVSVSLVGSATAQYVPLNAAYVKIGTVKVAATNGNVTLNTLTISRSGLGQVTGLKVSLAKNGVVVANARTFNASTQDALVRLNSPVTISNGSSETFDVLVSLPTTGGSANSQHQFAVTAANGTSLSSVTLGLINTTSYEVSQVNVSGFTAEPVQSGLSATRIANLKIDAPSSRDVTINGFTITKNNGNDLSQAITNVKVYRNGVVVDATATVTSDKIIVTGLNTKLAAGETANYELRADTIYVGDPVNYTLQVSNTEDVSATEDSTGYITQVDLGSYSPTLKIEGIKITATLVDTTTKNAAPGASSVSFLDGKLKSTASFEVRGFTLTPTVGGSNATLTQLQDIFSSLTLDVAGSNYDLLAGGTAVPYVYGTSDAYIMDANVDSTVRVRGTVKSGVNTTTYPNVKFVFQVTSLKNLDNGNTFTPATTITLNGNTINLRAASLDVRTATIAAPSSRNVVSSTNGVEIGRFALQSKYADVRVSKITVENGSTTSPITNLTSLADNASSFRLINLADGTEVDANKEFTSSGIEFTFSPDITVTKDTIANFKLVVDTKSIDSAEMAKKFSAKFTLNTNDVSTDNGNVSLLQNSVAATTTATTTGEEYTTAISMPTLKVSSVALAANSPVAKVVVTNNDDDNNIQIKSMKIRVQARSTANGTVDFSTATVCLRNLGATVACSGTPVITGMGGAVNGNVLDFTFTTPSINAASVISTNSSTDFEVFLSNAPLWVSGDYVSVSVEGADYVYGDTATPATPATDSYVGVSDASATSTK